MEKWKKSEFFFLFFTVMNSQDVVFCCASGCHCWRHDVSVLSDCPYVCSILVNTIA